MKDRHAADPLAERGMAGAILALPRSAKRLIMATADAVAIPTALWAALVLKFDTLTPPLDRTFAYFLVAVVSALFFFSMFGLYRAVIRFVGPKAMLTVSRGVSLSVLVLARLRSLLRQPPDSAVGVRHLLGARAAVRRRQPLRRRATCSCTPAATASRWRAWRSTAPATPARACARCCSADRTIEPVAFIDDKKSLQGSSINGVRVYGSDALPELVRQRRIDRDPARDAVGHRAGGGARSSRSSSRSACTCSRCRICPT